MSSAIKIWRLLAAFFLCYTNTIFSTPCGGLLRTMSSAKSLRYPTTQNSWRKVSCEWVIQTVSSRRVRLTFTDFVITTSCCSCERDYLEIRDGLNESAPLIGRFCAMHFPKVVYSTRENIWIKFESDFMRDINNRFRLSYEAICGHHMVSLSGSFTSPNFPANYNNNLDCIYSIEVPRGRIRVKFESFHIEGRMPVCLDDYLAVRETSGNVVYSQREKNGVSGKKFCGQGITPKIIYSTQSSYFWFHFKTNSFRTSAGFNATYRTVYAGKGSCDETLTENEGQIFSENYPFNFPRSKECEWKIKVPIGMHIHLSFLTFNFSKYSLGCSFGRLEVYDGVDLNFKVGLFCGSALPKKLISRTNEMSLRAVSSGSVNHTGWFALRYSTSSEGPCAKTQFTCHDRQCIDITLYCDSVKDCNDGSDELKCSVSRKTFSWYSFWPLSVALVVVLMGLWLWRTWKKFVGSRSEVERIYSPCTSSCHQHTSNTVIAEVTEPPSYNEAVQQGDQAPPSYEEAVAQVQSESITTVDSCSGSSQPQVNIQLDDCSNNSCNSHGSSYTEQFSTPNSAPEQRISQNTETRTRI